MALEVKTMRHAILVVLFWLARPCGAFAEEVPAYLDPEQPIEERSGDLVSRMTPEEKASPSRCRR